LSRRAREQTTSNGQQTRFKCLLRNAKRNFDTEFIIIYEFKPGTPNERFLWNALKQAERKNKILQEKRNSVIMGRGKDTIVSDYAINTQTDISLHNKTQNKRQEDQIDKEVHKKSMI